MANFRLAAREVAGNSTERGPSRFRYDGGQVSWRRLEDREGTIGGRRYLLDERVYRCDSIT